MRKNRWLSVVAWLLLTPFLLLAVVMTITPPLLRWQFSTVLSGSMEPTIHVGALAIVTPVNVAALKEGDIITFTDGSRRVTHRVVEVRGTPGSRSFVTKGDANNAPDDAEVPETAIVGKAIGSVPLIGRLALMLRTPTGMGIMAGLIAGAVFLSCASGAKKTVEHEQVSP